ncbi:MAG: iron-containing alcohol dehydrogenase [Clostridia bacterium]
MELFSVHPKIYEFDELQSFVKEFAIGKGELVLTNRCILSEKDRLLMDECSVLFQEKYGRGEPSDRMVAGIRSASAGQDFCRVIAIGGETVLDIAKLLVLPYDVPIEDLCEPDAVFEKTRELILVLTTCGIGSEMTNISIVTLTQKNVKQGLIFNNLYADAAVRIPTFIDALPYKPFAASLINALIHGVESNLSPSATDYRQILSSQTMERILLGIRRMKGNGEKARYRQSKNFLRASNLAPCL